MMLRVIFVYALVALASASITGDESPVNTTNLFGHDEIGLTRVARDLPECADQALGCQLIYLNYRQPFVNSIRTLTTIHAGPGFAVGLTSAAHQMLDCIENITDSCPHTAHAFTAYYLPKLTWIGNPIGIDAFARMDGTTCTSNPYADRKALDCRNQVCRRKWALGCMRERYTKLCSPAFAEFWINYQMLPNPC